MTSAGSSARRVFEFSYDVFSCTFHFLQFRSLPRQALAQIEQFLLRLSTLSISARLSGADPGAIPLPATDAVGCACGQHSG
jgi:hypothetical protein